jgi:hypothetical protein
MNVLLPRSGQRKLPGAVRANGQCTAGIRWSIERTTAQGVSALSQNPATFIGAAIVETSNLDFRYALGAN